MGLNLLNRQKIELAGLDIGTSSVKVVRLKKTGDGYSLVTALAEPIASSSDDEKQHHQSCLNSVRNCLQKAGLKNKQIVCGVSGPEVIIRGFTFPPLPDAAVPQAVQMEAQQVCPLDMKHSVLDFQLIETPSTEKSSKTPKVKPRRGVMVVGTERIIQDRVDLITEAGAKATMVDVNALALLNCLNELEMIDPQETVGIIDVGGTITSVVIYGHDGLPFVRDINTAAETIVKTISQDLDVPEEEVLRMFAQSQSSEQLDDKLLLSLNNATRPMANAVNETLRFYSFQEKQSGVDRIFLCGGFALIEPFVEFLSDALSVPVSVLNPFTKMTIENSGKEEQALIQNGPVYAIATGLALRTV